MQAQFSEWLNPSHNVCERNSKTVMLSINEIVHNSHSICLLSTLPMILTIHSLVDGAVRMR